MRLVRVAQTVDDPSHLPVDVDRRSRSPVEDHDAHWRGVDQRLQVGLGLPENLYLPVLGIVPVHLSPLYWAAFRCMAGGQMGSQIGRLAGAL